MAHSIGYNLSAFYSPRFGRPFIKRIVARMRRREGNISKMVEAEMHDRDLIVDMVGGAVAEWEHGAMPVGFQSRSRW